MWRAFFWFSALCVFDNADWCLHQNYHLSCCSWGGSIFFISITWTKWLKSCLINGFAKISADISDVGQNFTLILFSATRPRIKWTLISMCLIQFTYASLFAILIAFWCPIQRLIWGAMAMPTANANIVPSQTNSSAAAPSVIYSVSEDDIAAAVCFLDFHKIVSLQLRRNILK